MRDGGESGEGWNLERGMEGKEYEWLNYQVFAVTTMFNSTTTIHSLPNLEYTVDQ